MKTSKLIFVYSCLLGLTQLGWSQNDGAGAYRHGIPGYLDPHSRTFTTKAESSRPNQPLAGTAIVFRETFNFSISAQDVPSTDVIFCSAYIETEDTNGEWYDYNKIVATRSGDSASCSVPILVRWTLLNPTTDQITAEVYVYAVQGVSIGGGGYESLERYSDQPQITLSVPANDTTVTTGVSFTM